MSNTSSFSIVKISAMTLALLAAGCVVQPPLVSHATIQPVPVASVAPRVVSVYVDPPLNQPPPIAVAWAPPPMLVEAAVTSLRGGGLDWRLLDMAGQLGMGRGTLGLAARTRL